MGGLNFGRIKPTFLIIGIQKGGTTSLHNYLIQHPKVIAPNKKELHFFDTFESKNLNFFLNYFPKEYLTNTISFESTPRYIYYPGVAEKIFKFNPKMKLIILLRDPVKRAFSAWNMYKQFANIPHLQKYFMELECKSPKEKFHSYFYKNNFPDFDKWIEFELSNEFREEIIEPSIIRRGYYKQQIEHYFHYFPRKQLFFIDSESLKNEPLKILNSTADFLKIKSFTPLNINLKNSHERTYNEKINDETYRFLLNHYKIKNNGLEKLVDLKFSWQ